MTMKLQEQLNNLVGQSPDSKLYTSQRRYLYFLPEMESEHREDLFAALAELNRFVR